MAVSDGPGTAAPVAAPAPEPPDAQEAAAIERVQAGDTAAFDLLVRRYMRQAFAVAYRVLGHREDAEDVVQEAFLAALANIRTFDTSRRFGPWLYRIVVTRGLNFRKARSRRTTEALEDAGVASGAPGPAADAEQAGLQATVAAALARLPERQRMVVQLFELDGFSRRRDRHDARDLARHRALVPPRGAAGPSRHARPLAGVGRMNDPARWSHDQDPPRDDALARQLRAADGAAPGQDVDWERLRTAIMRGAARAGGPAARLPPGEWWDVVVRWRQVAAAASVAAMLAAGALVWRSGGGRRGVRGR